MQQGVLLATTPYGEVPQIVHREFSLVRVRLVALHRGNASDSLGAVARSIH